MAHATGIRLLSRQHRTVTLHQTVQHSILWAASLLGTIHWQTTMAGATVSAITPRHPCRICLLPLANQRTASQVRQLHISCWSVDCAQQYGHRFLVCNQRFTTWPTFKSLSLSPACGKVQHSKDPCHIVAHNRMHNFISRIQSTCSCAVTACITMQAVALANVSQCQDTQHMPDLIIRVTTYLGPTVSMHQYKPWLLNVMTCHGVFLSMLTVA
jgi:hypothetical protein